VSTLAAIRRGRSFGAKISGGRGRPWGIFFVSYKTRHILLSNSANCTVLRAVILTQYRRVTDGQTDEIGVASTALAMRCAVKTARPMLSDHCPVSLTLVSCGQTVEWIKMPFVAEVGLGLGHIVIDGNPVPPPKKRHNSPFHFSIHIYCGQTAKRLDGSRCHLVRRQASAQATLC